MTCQLCGEPVADQATCPACRTRLHWQLVDLPQLYQQLQLEAVEATPPPSVRSSRGKRAPLPLPVDLLDVLLLRVDDLDGMAALETWAGLTLEGRKLTWPRVPETYAGRIGLAAGILDRHLDYVLEQEWAPTAAGHIGLLVRAMRRQLEADATWRRTRLPCPDCQAPLWVDNIDPANPTLTCRADGCEAPAWYPEAWEMLGELIGGSVTMGDVSGMLGIPYRTVQSWVQRGEVPNVGTAGRPRVVLADVLARYRKAAA